MKRILPLITCLIIATFSSFAQEVIISYEKVQSYTVEGLDSLMADVGVPPGIVVPEYGIDIYKVLYKTPYIHLDSLVQASGAIIVPQVDCPLPLANYQHGTQSKRSSAPSSLNGGQIEVAMIFASTGYVVTVPDYLGLGDSDPKVIIHPYIHAFSQAHTSINILRASREIAADQGVTLNDQLFLFGYSQGGFGTAALHKEIEENYSDEFQITASAPMSGPYDLKEAQVDLIASDEPYPTPGYLPFIFLAYQSIYGNLYEESISEVLKAPYDSLVPALFYSGEYSIGYINGQVPDVPKTMVKDSVIDDFMTNADHPLRLDLNDNHLLDWAPEAPIKLYYCKGDEQVSYLNSENAYDSWTANGAPSVEKQDFGNLKHNDCALFCFLDARLYFNSFADSCIVNMDTTTSVINTNRAAIEVYPNPASYQVNVLSGLGVQNQVIRLYNVLGELVLEERNTATMDVSQLPTGTYIYEITQNNKALKNGRLAVVR